MPGVGDVDIPQLTVTPFDNTTAATVTVLHPDGTSTTPVTSTADLGHTWTATPVTLNAAGWWVYAWAVTGTGAGAEARRVYVEPNPTAGGPTWTPSRERVASYVPGRTLVGAVDGYGSPIMTFDATTHPAGAAVDRLIADAVAWVELATGPVDLTLYDAATCCAAVYTAYSVELAYPDNTRDTAVATQLYQQAVAMRTDLGLANAAITGHEPEDPAAHLMPQYSFPSEQVQSPWGDLDFL